jgi:hypothetical protein
MSLYQSLQRKRTGGNARMTELDYSSASFWVVFFSSALSLSLSSSTDQNRHSRHSKKPLGRLDLLKPLPPSFAGLVLYTVIIRQTYLHRKMYMAFGTWTVITQASAFVVVFAYVYIYNKSNTQQVSMHIVAVNLFDCLIMPSHIIFLFTVSQVLWLLSPSFTGLISVWRWGLLAVTINPHSPTKTTSLSKRRYHFASSCL